MLDEVELSTQQRDFGVEQDLELDFDHNQQRQERDLRTKVIFAIQGLGGIRTINKNGKQLQAYIKGVHCEDSVKDLVKFIQKDTPQNPQVRLILSGFNIVQSDLIQLLVLQVQDKKLSFWLVALLNFITNKPSESLTNEITSKLNQSLRSYKLSFIKHQCLTILTVHIADYFKTAPQSRQKPHFQMLEFIILLLRNLLQISDNSQQPDSNLHNHFLTTFIRQEMFHPLLYLIQTQKGQLIHKLKIPLLEIFFYTFTCFNPHYLYRKKEEIIYHSKTQRTSQNGLTPLNRHSRFLPTFKQKSFRGITRVTHSLGQKQQPSTNQRKEPNRISELKRVKRIQQSYMPQNFMEIQIEVLQNDQTHNKSINVLIFELAKQFIQVEFAQLAELVFEDIYRQSNKIVQNNIIQYLLLCSWVLNMTRCKYENMKSTQNSQQQRIIQFDLWQVACIMQTAHFQLIYKLLFRQATREKKKNFKINLFHAALSLFQHYLDVISDIAISFNVSDRKNANILMANMFRHDIARIFKIGFHQITHELILQKLIIVCHKFFKLLSEYSHGKVLTIQTNRILKRKIKKKINIQERQYEDMNNSFSSEQKPMVEQNEEENKIMFQERKFNEISQFTIIAEYEIISKYLLFLKKQAFLTNSNQLNQSIFFYIQRIVTLLHGQWLFFQAETLIIFWQILANPQFCRLNKSKQKLVTLICRQFIKLFQTNRLALVESLFRYPNLSVKDQILNNYEGQQKEINMNHHHVLQLQ